MAFYEYSQNNSGGHFEVNEKLCRRLFIEADSYSESESIAEDLGVYFNGVDEGVDCGCCGDRWYSGDEVDLSEINENGYGVSVYVGLGDAEKVWRDRYGAYEIHTEPDWQKTIFREFSGKIKFRNIEEYAQFLADKYGWTTPDARIFYKDGKVTEINKRKGVR
ncbi:DUF7296 family protein [Bacillus pumilus]|uniref:DUF7296 family protein n=1 Tax=Bacillus pumilus TaxID=1408 RepID=UPI0015D53F74|nr:hypothetical protein [Bacillus pumilus]QLI77094.1 hypothetical protein HZ310_04425 [Bacillus pumilus]